MSIEEIKSIKKLKEMLRIEIMDNKYLKECCEKAGFELAKNSFEWDGKPKNLVVYALELNRIIDQLKAENKELKEELEELKEENEYNEANAIEFKQTLTEIKEIAEENDELLQGYHKEWANNKLILQKISECEVENETTNN